MAILPKTVHSAPFPHAVRAAPLEALVADTRLPRDDRTGIAGDPAEQPANDDAGKAPEKADRTDAERELTERVRRKINSIRKRTKRYVN